MQESFRIQVPLNLSFTYSTLLHMACALVTPLALQVHHEFIVIILLVEFIHLVHHTDLGVEIHLPNMPVRLLSPIL